MLRQILVTIHLFLKFATSFFQTLPNTYYAWLQAIIYFNVLLSWYYLHYATTCLSKCRPAGRHFSAVSWAWSGTFKITCIAGRHNKVIFDNNCPKIEPFDFASKDHNNSQTLKFYDSNIVSIT